jgi:predicted protein tyrosine phosphatase
MIKSSMNQLGNLNNPYQGNALKVLCCCSAGMLRSPTLANYLAQHKGYNTRAVGCSYSFALVPISEALVRWADQIWFVEKEVYEFLDVEVEQLINELGTMVVILDIPDEYPYGAPELVNIIKQQVFELYDDFK